MEEVALDVVADVLADESCTMTEQVVSIAGPRVGLYPVPEAHRTQGLSTLRHRQRRGLPDPLRGGETALPSVSDEQDDYETSAPFALHPSEAQPD